MTPRRRRGRARRGRGRGRCGAGNSRLSGIGWRFADRWRPVGLLGPQPCLEVCGADDICGRAHERVARPAQLGALDRIGPDAGRRDPQRGRDPGHGIDLLGELGDEEAVDHVQRANLEHHGLALGEVQVGRDDLVGVAAVDRIGELKRELALGDVDRHLALLARLVVAQRDVRVRTHRDQQHRGHRRPNDLQPRVAVDRGPVLELLSGLHPELPDRIQDDRLDEHEDRHRRDQQDVVERVDAACLLRSVGREPRDDQRDRDQDRCGHDPDHQHLQQRVLTHVCLRGPRASLLPASYAFCATDDAGSKTVLFPATATVMIEAIVASKRGAPCRYARV